MYCSNCGNENTETAKYCCKCGSALVSKKIVLNKDGVDYDKEIAENFKQTTCNNEEININDFNDKLKTSSKKQIKVIALIVPIIAVACVVGAIIYKNNPKGKTVSASNQVEESKVITSPDKNLEQGIGEQTKKPTGSILKDEDNANTDYILPNSSTEELKELDLESLNERKLMLARNEVFARHGLVFKTQEIKSYFDSKSWYHQDLSYKGEINSIEEFNIKLIKKMEEGNTDNSTNLPDIKNQDIITFCNDANGLLLDIEAKRNSDEFQNNSNFYAGLDEPYLSKEKIKDALSKYFTKAYVEKFMGNGSFIEKDGKLYFMVGQAGRDSLYNYTSIKNRNNKGSIIQAVANATYKDDGSFADDGDIKIKLENGEWKIDSFHSAGRY